MYLSVLRYIFKSRSKRGLYDLNKKAEPFFCRLLNYIYGWKLENLNSIQNNYPAIDLGDQEAGVCVQVTAENSSSKIKKTIKTFENNKLHKTYGRLVFLILTEKKNYTTKLTTKEIDFSLDNDVIDIDDLLEVVEELGIEDLEEIHRFLSKELSSIVKLFAEKTSLLSQIPEFSGIEPAEDNKFYEFLELSGEELVGGREKIFSLFNTLKLLSKRSREYLYLLVERAKIENVGMMERLYALPADIESYSGLTRQESREEFQILESHNLACYENEDSPPRIEIFFPMDFGVDLFAMLREYLVDSESMKRLIVDCDFSVLNG